MRILLFETADHLAGLAASDLRFILRALEQRWQLNREFVIAEAVGALDHVLRLPSLEVGSLGKNILR